MGKAGNNFDKHRFKCMRGFIVRLSLINSVARTYAEIYRQLVEGEVR
jgi:hypothetical protein